MKDYRQAAPAQTIVKELENIAVLDKFYEKKRSNFGKIAVFALPLAIVFFILIGATADSIPSFLQGILVILLIASIIAFPVGVIQYVRYNIKDIEDRKIQIALKFARIIGVDMKKTTPLQLAVSFEDYETHGKVVVGDKRNGRFIDEWFQARGKLTDDTVFDVGILRKVNKKSRAKRKYTKVKVSMQEIVTVILKPEPGAFSRLDQFPNIINRTRAGIYSKSNMRPLQLRRTVVDNGAVRVDAITNKYIKITGRSTQQQGASELVTADQVLGLMLESYNALRGCK